LRFIQWTGIEHVASCCRFESTYEVLG